MDITFLDAFDVLRVMAGSITCILVFTHGAAPRREDFARRLITAIIAAALWSALYAPAMYLASHTGFLILYVLLVAVWWLACNFVALWFVWYICDISVSNLLFRGLMGLALQSILNMILRYAFVTMLFPDYDERHPAMYILVVIADYALFEVFFYRILARRMQDSGHTVVLGSLHNLRHCIVTLTILSLTTDLASAVLEFSVEYSESDTVMLHYLNAYLIPCFCIFAVIVVCAITLFNQYTTYQMLAQRQETELLKQLEQEKAQQYEFSKENIDLINQKCHDLKYRIQALKLAEGEQKERLIEDVSSNIQFYDAAVQTDNPTLNTILTEKSLVCTGAGIRLSCNVQTGGLSRIEVIDLYTMLGNALDNAIECVRQYDDPDKKTISLSIREKGSMVHIFVDNYYEGQLEVRDGFPVTGKADKRYHGFGVKSINMIAKRYEGDSMVSVSGNTFSLHIMIPA